MNAERIVAFDLLRTAMLFMLMIFHAGVSFMNTTMDPELWTYQDNSTNIFFDGLLAFIHTFRHPAFFIISGFVTELMYRHYSGKEVFTRRFKRIFIPFIVVMLFIGPFVNGLLAQVNGAEQPFSMDILFPVNAPYVLRISTSFVWFLYYLFLFGLVHALFNWSGLTGQTAKNYSSKNWLIFSICWLILLLSVSLYLWNQNSIFGQYSLVPDAGSLLGYFAFYLFGISLCRIDNGIERLKKHCVQLTAIGFVFFLTYIVLGFLRLEANADPLDFDWLLMLSSTIATVFISLGVLGLALKYYTKSVPVINYLSRSSYFLYLVHFPFVLIILHLIQKNSWNAFMKFFTILIPVIIIALGLNHLWIKLWKGNPPL